MCFQRHIAGAISLSFHSSKNDGVGGSIPLKAKVNSSKNMLTIVANLSLGNYRPLTWRHIPTEKG